MQILIFKTKSIRSHVGLPSSETRITLQPICSNIEANATKFKKIQIKKKKTKKFKIKKQKRLSTKYSDRSSQIPYNTK